LTASCGAFLTNGSTVAKPAPARKADEETAVNGGVLVFLGVLPSARRVWELIGERLRERR